MKDLKYIIIALLISFVSINSAEAFNLKTEQSQIANKKNYTNKKTGQKASPKPSSKKANVSKNALTHINNRHGSNSPAKNTSKFNSNFTDSKIKSIVKHTFDSNDKWKPSKNNPNRLVKEHTYKKPIGKNTNGTPAKTLRIVSDKNGEIVTAFPAR